MKKLNDKEIQNYLENNKNTSSLVDANEEDFEIYSKLFRILKENKTTEMPQNFSKRVVNTILEKENNSFNIKCYLLLGFLVLMGLYVALNLFDDGYFTLLFQSVLDNKSLIIFGIIATLSIEFLSRKLRIFKI